MPTPNTATPQVTSGFKALLLGASVAAVALACLWILLPFLAAVAWAVILAYTSWPLYRLVRRPFGRFQASAAGAMTALLSCAVILPVLWMGILAADEIATAYRALAAYLAQPLHELPGFIRRVPWLAEPIRQLIDRFAAEPLALKEQIIKWLQAWSGELAAMAGGFGRNLGKLLVTLLTVFFLYRDGDALVLQCRRVVGRFFGTRIDPYMATIAGMTRAVVYGLAVTAVAQGLIAGIGYALVGVEGAVLLGTLTGMLSLLPVVGTLAVWGMVAVYLLATGHVVKGILLMLWGAFLVHPTDNVLRPLLISNATHVPFLIVMFGVVGGVSAFGLVGAFVGPVFLAVGLALWREAATPAKSGPVSAACSVEGSRTPHR